MGKVKNLEVYESMFIVVDMVNGFVREGVLHDEEIAKVIPRQIELIKEARNNGSLVVFIKDTHNEEASEFRRFGNTKHCVRGTSEAEIVDELLPFVDLDDTISIEKNSTSFMEVPDFRRVATDARNIRRVDVVGCCTDICDFNGIMGYANFSDQHNRGIEFNLHTDAVATYSEGARQNYVDAAYLLMEQQGIQLVKKR